MSLISADVVIDTAAFLAVIADGIEPVIKSTSSGIITGMQTAFRLPKSGKTYRRRGGRIHRASAPGEPAAIDYGNLERSIKASFPSKTLGLIEIGAAYAEDLEFVSNRSFVRPTIKGVVAEANKVTGAIP